MEEDVSARVRTWPALAAALAAVLLGVPAAAAQEPGGTGSGPAQTADHGGEPPPEGTQPPPEGGEAPPGPPAPEPEIVSDEVERSYWAYAQTRGWIRSAPSAGAERVGRLALLTQDRLPEVYLVLRRLVVGEQTWLEVRIPRRPNGRTGWVLADALGRLHLVATRLVVDRTRLQATLFRHGKRIWRSRIGVGARRTPTPAGQFYIRERLTGFAFGTLYGPVAFGTSAYSSLSEWPRGGVIGIHGTNQPQLLPGRVSHGCIRVPNRAILRLARLMPIGTPVLIR
jgi:hypothetical protein